MPRSRVRVGTSKAGMRKITEHAPPGRAAVSAGSPISSSSTGSGKKRSATQEPLQGWKAIVHKYVKLYNQAEIDRYAPPFEEIISDTDHLVRFTGRLERLKEQELLRGILPSRSETNAELIRVSESTGSLGEVAVLIELRTRRTIDHHGRTYVEERCDRERLWLTADGDAYMISRVEPIVLERRPRYSSSDIHEDLEPIAPAKPQSIPYINYDVLPNFKHSRAGIRYRRDLVAAYADRWWNEPNPAYENFEVNCTNYISQCVFAGNAPMNYTGRRDTGWWYRGYSGGRENWSYSWAVANALKNYLSTPHKSGFRATVVDSADQLALGDVIIYDWSGDNRYQHSTVVTAFDAAGMPLVNANTVPSRHRYWDYQDSYAWTENTQYRFFHIADEF
ncbi:putative amidase-like protein [Paenibacillus taihuensis]|uniref:Putative amidase-like protein n=1 Tax=Paenibacillus taihuensis TaxID=1156355 RepID=A0A3D9SC38_9BACL|nr:amidase domain-containing protein [Paenibacillus taihuensis]REE90545.1 putative amidase-like protein [Paenibacillus taihuensis]